MKITCIWKTEGKYPSFDVHLSSGEGKQAFLEIKGCKIIEGTKGPFISWPAKKLDSGKYWNHVYASEGFQVAVIDEARKSEPKVGKPQTRPADDDDIPF